MSLFDFHRTLVGSDFRSYVANIGLWFHGGHFRQLTVPSTLWMNGKTYACGYEAYSPNNNKVWIVEQEGTKLTYTEAGVGTNAPETIDHPTPLLLTNPSTGYIYVIQNDFHVDAFNLFKSDNTHDSTSFTQVGQFDTDGAYLVTLDYSDVTDVKFLTRFGNSGSGGYDVALLSVNLDTAAYTDLQLTEGVYGTNNVRHYPMCAYFSGTSDYRIGFINHRWDNATPSANYYKISIFLLEMSTGDIYNFTEGFSKDVSSSGALTVAELETNFVFDGTDTDKQNTNVFVHNALQVDDDLYIIWYNDSDYVLEKYTIGSLTATASITLPEGGAKYDIFTADLTHNGDRLVMMLKDDVFDKWHIYTCEYDLTGLTQKEQLGNIPAEKQTPESGRYVGLPKNLQDVDGEYLIIGRSEIGNVGTVPYYTTTETYKD